jgi:CTP-dependent riboflavin kinase
MFLNGTVVKGWGKATKFWSDFPEEYKLLFKEFYPGTLNVKVTKKFNMIAERVMVLKYPTFLFNAEWEEAEWRSVNYLPAKVNGVSGFLITLDPPSIGRPKDILEFILVDKVEDDNVEIEIL